MIPKNSKSAVVASVCLALLLGLSFHAPALGKSKSAFHVRGKRCSNAGPGTKAKPFCTIGRGAAAARPGDTVIVHGGTYREQVTVPRSGTPRAPILFTAAKGNKPVVTGRTYGFEVKRRKWITIRGFTIRDTIRHGIHASEGARVTIAGNEVYGAGSPAAGQFAQGIHLRAMSDSLIERNKVHHNSDHGIELGVGTRTTTVRFNEVYGNARQFTRAAAGIQVAGASAILIEANLAYGNEDSGINVREGASDNLVARNAAWGNGDHGFDTLRATGTRYIANSAYGNAKDGISVETSSTGTTIANCISVQNGRYELYVDASSVPATTADYDILWDVDPASPDVHFGGTAYDTIASFSTATAQEAHGIGADPMFVNPAAGDLHLLPGSPAIDSANSGASGHPLVDLEGKARVDDPAVTDTGAGPRTFDDRGAYERQVGS